MSLAVAVPLGIASAAVYGTSIVYQHRASDARADEDARNLLRLLRDPRWLLAIGGDLIGFILNIGALSAGPVVIIQPLVVLMLPVAMIVGSVTGGQRPARSDYLASLAILGGLACFLVLVGRPGAGHIPRARFVGMAVVIVLVAGALICAAVQRSGTTVRAAAYGVVAGMYFGTLGVMVDALSDVVAKRGFAALVTTGRGLFPLVGLALLGLGGIVLTQLSFQVGALQATLPANLAADPFTAVLVGAILLREHIPHAPVHLFAYALCLAAVIAGAVQLASHARETVRDRTDAALTG